jgi:hypothetical protein
LYITTIKTIENQSCKKPATSQNSESVDNKIRICEKMNQKTKQVPKVSTAIAPENECTIIHVHVRILSKDQGQ